MPTVKRSACIAGLDAGSPNPKSDLGHKPDGHEVAAYRIVARGFRPGADGIVPIKVYSRMRK